MNKILLLFAGGGTGTVFRYSLSAWSSRIWATPFPIGTLAVNLTGCLIIGLLAGWHEKAVFEDELRLLIFTGVLGGFTTFSSFSIETVQLLKNGNTGQAIAYVLVSTAGGILLSAIGYFLLRIKS